MKKDELKKVIDQISPEMRKEMFQILNKRTHAGQLLDQIPREFHEDVKGILSDEFKDQEADKDKNKSNPPSKEETDGIADSIMNLRC